jgi:hypothetical protein
MHTHWSAPGVYQEKLSNPEVFLRQLRLFRPKFSHRCLFGVLQVTSLLLLGERRKLSVLQRELQAALEEGGSIKAKEQQKHELILAIS